MRKKIKKLVKILLAQPLGSRERDRRRLRWKDEVDEIARMLGIRYGCVVISGNLEISFGASGNYHFHECLIRCVCHNADLTLFCR